MKSSSGLLVSVFHNYSIIRFKVIWILLVLVRTVVDPGNDFIFVCDREVVMSLPLWFNLLRATHAVYRNRKDIKKDFAEAYNQAAEGVRKGYTSYKKEMELIKANRKALAAKVKPLLPPKAKT